MDNQCLDSYKKVITDKINDKTLKEQGLLIDKYLIPKVLEKKQNAEVSTPYKLRQDMLNTIPTEFWTKPNKVFEPCSGKGGFLIDIVDRFMDGLESLIPDKEERYKTIVEECLYYSDINSTNIFISKLLLDPMNMYKLNYNEGDTLKLNIKDKWNVDNFDAIIGNPPYNMEFNVNGAGASPLYNHFIKKLIDNCVYLLFVVPSRWFAGGKGLDKFRKFMLKRTDIKLIAHVDDSVEWFGKIVDIQGGVNYFLKDKNYKGSCSFNGIKYNLNDYDIIINPDKISLINKVKDKESIVSIYKGRHFGIETNDKRLKSEKSDNSVKCYVSYRQSKDRIKYLDYNLTKDKKFWKVYTAKAYGNQNVGFGYMSIAKPDEVHSGSYISFKVNNEQEAKSLLSYLKTDIINELLKIRKVSQDINGKTCKWIPLPPLDREWDNNKVIKWLNK